MSEHALPVLLGTIGGASLFAAIVGRRVGNDKRDIRLLALIGSAMSGLAVTLFSFTRI
jgi:hypothetical protein